MSSSYCFEFTISYFGIGFGVLINFDLFGTGYHLRPSFEVAEKILFQFVLSVSKLAIVSLILFGCCTSHTKKAVMHVVDSADVANQVDAGLAAIDRIDLGSIVELVSSYICIGTPSTSTRKESGACD